MDNHIHRKLFPAVQRSRTTVFGSGIPGADASRAQLAPPAPQQISLYREDSETTAGSFTPDNDFIISYPINFRGLEIEPCDVHRTARKSPPSLSTEDKENRRGLPCKSTAIRRSKRKKRKRSRKVPITGNKRPRTGSPGHGWERNYPQKNTHIKYTKDSRRTRRPSPTPDQGLPSGSRHKRHPMPPIPKAPFKPMRLAAISVQPSTQPSSDDDRWSTPPAPGLRHRDPSEENAGFIPQKARKTKVQLQSAPAPPLKQPEDPLASDEIARGIVRLDPPLARYSFRRAPLFLSRNLRDGWVAKVRAWDKVAAKPVHTSKELGTPSERLDSIIQKAIPAVTRDVTRTPLPPTFSLRIQGLQLSRFAAEDKPHSIQLAAMLYINNPSSDQISLYLGSFKLTIPESSDLVPETLRFHSTPLRIPLPDNKCATIPSSWLTRANTAGRFEDRNVSLRALEFPGGIAYIDLLLCDFADDSMELKNISLHWTAARAHRAYARIELIGPNAGPNGFGPILQRVPIQWMQHTPSTGSSVPTDLQPTAFLTAALDWGVDSAAPFIQPRLHKPRFSAPTSRTPSPKPVRFMYQMKLQDGERQLEEERSAWSCALCTICAPFPSLHVLKVHIIRAHPQVEVKLKKRDKDPVTGHERCTIRLTLPPEVIELSDDEEETPPAETVAPSAVINALITGPDEDSVRLAPTVPSTPTNQFKEEQEPSRDWIVPTEELLPIERHWSRSPTIVFDSPIRPRRDSETSDIAFPPQLDQPTNATERAEDIHGYRIHYKPRIYDVLQTLPMNFGLLNEQVIANEEEMFAEDSILELAEEGSIYCAKETRLMGALWTRWLMTEKNWFIANPFECWKRFVNSDYIYVVIDHVGYKPFVRFATEMASRGKIKPKEAAILCRAYKAREQARAEA